MNDLKDLQSLVESTYSLEDGDKITENEPVASNEEVVGQLSSFEKKLYVVSKLFYHKEKWEVSKVPLGTYSEDDWQMYKMLAELFKSLTFTVVRMRLARWDCGLGIRKDFTVVKVPPEKRKNIIDFLGGMM